MVAPSSKIPSHDIETGENTPLLTSTDVPNDREQAEHAAFTAKYKTQTLLEKAVGGAAVVAMGSSVVSMCIEDHPAVVISGVAGFAVPPYAAIQQKKLTELEQLSEINEIIGVEIGKLSGENERLNAQVGKLEASVTRLEELDKTLETVQELEGSSLEMLEEQLEDSKNILARMEMSLKSVVLQNIMNIVMRCDTDGDMDIEDNEITLLVKKIKNIDGVKLNEERFRKKIKDSGNSIRGVITLIKGLLNEDDPPEDELIFDIDEKVW
eukprot:CAMPEP_0172514728 /NCGR_PEP_ID=MMETSP1066-20121228/262301_1 /TAXON_ID=671091 /ORGANISM="Coscinodiscus wailesii, Strain CCMP2513" /LENGTH=266 /DNA_ID=CAMNT_0013295505 /DNA_START=57 /DNA_END=854 /DNA_ORIENTATION=+